MEEIEQLYRDQHGYYIKIIRNKGGIDNTAEAEDIVQDAFTRVLDRRHLLTPLDLSKWFSKVVTNCYRDYMNAKRHNFQKAMRLYNSHSDDLELISFQIGGDALACYEAIRGVMQEMIKKEVPANQEFLQDYFICLLPYQHTVDTTGMKKENLFSIAQRFRNKLKRNHEILSIYSNFDIANTGNN